jgi:outer membrane protein assembly factor BamA
MRLPARLVVAVAACLLLARPVSADVSDFLGKTVTAVAVRSEGRPITDRRILALVETATGRPLAMGEVRDSLTHLFSLAIYEDVQVRASAVADGVSLTYELVPIHPVSRIAFAGADGPGIDEEALRQLLFDRFGRSPRAARADDMANVVQDALRDDGYLRVRVTSRATVRHGPEETELTFTIEPGPRARIGEVAVEGNAAM